jgi:hypothetical protein
VFWTLLRTKKCFYVSDRLCRYLDFPVIDNEFVHQLSSRINIVSGTLLQHIRAVKLLLDACINIIFLLTRFTATFRPTDAEIQCMMQIIMAIFMHKKKTVCKSSILPTCKRIIVYKCGISVRNTMHGIHARIIYHFHTRAGKNKLYFSCCINVIPCLTAKFSLFLFSLTMFKSHVCLL